MNRILELRSHIAYVEDCLADVHSRNEGALSEEVRTSWDAGVTFLDEARAELADLEARQKIADASVGAKSLRASAPNFIPSNDGSAELDTRSASRTEVREAAMRCIERADKTYLGSIGDERSTMLEAAISRGETRNYSSDMVARTLVAQAKPAYESAFIKGISNRSDEWTQEERSAMAEARAQSIGTTTEGGFGVPIIIDPTIMITSGQSRNPLINAVRVEAITTSEWKGITSPQAAWSMDAESAEVSDDTIAIAQPSILTEKPEAFIPYTIEVGMDYPGFATEMGRVLSQGYTYLVAQQLAVGTGTSPQTTGLFVGATTAVNVGADNTLAPGDIDAIYAATPEDFRANGTWVMNVDVENEIRAFGSGSATSRFTVNQTEGGITLLNGKPVVLTDHAPAWSATDAQNILVFGDMDNFIMAQRLGMTMDVISHLMGANRRPTGQRGLYGYARFGAGVPVVNAFRRLKNITT
ncbi:phage major capsid protein [Ilumatobacter sp.]|uniref:phage major capsid protein n=1 Tax=Ilumatobacter sp. TaxID=1967498 RepID=UPI003753C4DD